LELKHKNYFLLHLSQTGINKNCPLTPESNKPISNIEKEIFFKILIDFKIYDYSFSKKTKFMLKNPQTVTEKYKI
jgi:hypothetical protein